MDALTESGLVAEVADGTFSFKNKINAASVKLLWDKLSRFIADSLKQQKGVLVPNLGTFHVGPVVGETRKKVRPAFSLLETRYSGVSQERPKYSIGGRCPVVQPNYGLLAAAAAVHRGACQRLVLELMQRLGVHILSGRLISVLFPGVGRLFTNKAGRIQFEFDKLLREYFELERERVILEMSGHEQAEGAGPAKEVAEVVKGLQHVHLHNPPVVRSKQANTTPSATPGSPSSQARRHAHAPYKGALLDLWRLCKSNDRINSGCVPRLQLEQWLYKECAPVLRQVAAATVLELLSTNTYGKTGKHILYKPFLDQLEAAVGNVSPVENSPQSVQSPRRIVEVRIDSPSSAQRRQQQEREQAGGHHERDVVEVTLSPTSEGHHPVQGQQQPYRPYQAVQAQYAQQAQYPSQGWATPQEQFAAQGPYPQQGQHQGFVQSSPQGQYPQQRQYLPQAQLAPQGQYPPQGQYAPAGQYTPQGQYSPHGPYGAHGQYSNQAQNLARDARQPSPLVLPQTPGDEHQAWWGSAQGPNAPGSEGTMPYHYFQNKLSPRSRREYDNFNRLHFRELEEARGQNYKNRAVTPKVGEDELNRREYYAIRHAGDAVTPEQVLGLQSDQPYSRNTPQPVVAAARHRGSPGPKPQILTLAHQQPSPSLSPHVPGLPTHAYQPSPQPQRPRSARQLTPPQPLDESPPISQYEIINEPDPLERQRKRNELAHALQRNWSEQIREKEMVLEEISEAEARWPYAPTHQPNDKRPPSAVSRPPSAALR